MGLLYRRGQRVPVVAEPPRNDSSGQGAPRSAPVLGYARTPKGAARVAKRHGRTLPARAFVLSWVSGPWWGTVAP